ncbi:Uma2 family endonuclease [Fodinicola acaciae]|uniref:Uma2 family endonuclease n=1 Tax=Fodinicola acaciae TaxID=2681555 RepID=UPI0013D569D5|nr:Uma2 family endonuclease [Fodinicola acaciae]
MSVMAVHLPQGPPEPSELIELPVSSGAPITVELFRRFPPRTRLNIVGGTVFAGRDGGFDVADLDRLDDDGWRHELIDGVIVMSPAPSHPHQRAVMELAFALRTAVPDNLEVLVAPFDVRLGKRRRVQPDVIVAPKVDLGNAVPVPKLVVEVLSPSGQRYDLIAKRRLYEQARVESYWIVDPGQPSLTVLELRDGRYAEIGTATGSAELVVEQPVKLRLRPHDLLS